MRLQNWSKEQEEAFQQWLLANKKENNSVPELLIKPFRKGFRDRNYKPEWILKHRGLLR